MNAKEEIYTVGNYSRIVGSELEALNLARLRRKVIISNLIFDETNIHLTFSIFVIRYKCSSPIIIWICVIGLIIESV